MASPKLESYCCMSLEHNDSCINDSYPRHYDKRSITISYNILCIVSASMSICGALYQLKPRLPRRPPRSRTKLESMLRQNTIICLLAIADLLASVGILARSSLWASYRFPMEPVQLDDAVVDPARIFCAVSSAWVHFFYICTYLWTLIYAVDILRLVKKKSCPLKLYHAVCWGTSTVFSFIGLFFLYYPSLLRYAILVLLS